MSCTVRLQSVISRIQMGIFLIPSVRWARPVILLGLGLFFLLIIFLLLYYGSGEQAHGPLFLSIFLKGYGALCGLLLVYALIQWVRVRSVARSSRETRPDQQFLVETYNDLIHTLKEKEERLSLLMRKAEARADRIERDHVNILQSIPSGVIAFDHDMRVLAINAAAARILNWIPEHAVGQSVQTIFYGHAAVAAMMEMSQTEHRQEHLIARVDGEQVWLGITASTLCNAQHEVLGTTVVFADLTEVKRLQEHVELKRRLADLGEISGWISHEFRNNMGTILGYAKLLGRRLSTDAKAQEMALAIEQEVIAMERLITEILSYAKKERIKPVPVELAALLQGLVAGFAKRFPQVVWKTQWEEVQMVLDETLIRQAFSNLIQNAIEAMGAQGQITLSVSGMVDETIQVAIADSGPGVPREARLHLFSPFFTTKSRGTGLGLALAHKIVLAHGGSIHVHNLEESGAVFTVHLPRRAQGDTGPNP